MRVIFLDVDGVLLTSDALRRAQRSFGMPPRFSAQALAALRELKERTGASLVITSSWRPTDGKAPARPWLWLLSVLARNHTPVTDTTPRLPPPADRGGEIAAWLEARPAEAFVILDDSDRFASCPELRARWVRVDPETGLTEEQAAQALRLL